VPGTVVDIYEYKFIFFLSQLYEFSLLCFQFIDKGLEQRKVKVTNSNSQMPEAFLQQRFTISPGSWKYQLQLRSLAMAVMETADRWKARKVCKGQRAAVPINTCWLSNTPGNTVPPTRAWL
jgi:hypothetical protein